MQSYTGKLQELGQATISHRARHSFSNYSYMQVGDTMVKNIACWHGLDGKLQQELGHEITLYTKDGFVEAIEASDGKTYSGERTRRSVWIMLLAGWFCVPMGGAYVVDMTHSKFFGFVAAIALAILTYRIYKYFDKSLNEGADLPNAIRIPKA